MSGLAALIMALLTAVALSMDAFAVSISAGTQKSRNRLQSALKLGVAFGFFQFIMPVIGSIIGLTVSVYILDYVGWIALIILCIIGISMIREGLSQDDDEEEKLLKIDKPLVLLILAIATSIDALAVGFSFAILGGEILILSVIIGITTFAFSFAGFYLGKLLGDYIQNKAVIFGGIILIFIGLNIAFNFF